MTFLTAVFFVVSVPAHSMQRVALVIGNSAYEHVPMLTNPVNDATDIGTAFERLGFDVTRIENVGQQKFRRALQEFGRAAAVSEVAVIFYAGHGIEVDQRNYLIPVDARLASDRDVEFETIGMDLVMRAVDGASELKLVILDACRDNPFAVLMQRAGATRSIGRGLARVEPVSQTLVAYAAKGGTVASDGVGRNSPYSKALLSQIETPGLELDLMFRRVRDEVLRLTGGRQEPFTYGSLSSQGAYLAQPVTGVSHGNLTQGRPMTESENPQIQLELLSLEREFWESIKTSDDVADFHAYLNRFSNGIYVDLARNRIKRLKKANSQNISTSNVTNLEVPASKPPTPDEIEFSLELSRSERREVQEGLAVAGFNPGAADGLFGQRTRVAIGRWQLSSGADKTGYLDAKSARVLIALAAEFVPARSPGDVFRDCKSCPQMVVVPAGDYMMGSPSSEEYRSDDESPRHRVTISKPFAVGKYEVTRGEFREFVSDTGHSSGRGCNFWAGEKWKKSDVYSWRNPGFEQGEDDPVVCVNWNDAKAYVKWLSGETGHQYRLLSESEWEYVARAGTTAPFYFGRTISTDQANYNGEYVYGSGRKGVYREKTVSVGSFPSNGYGLHDVHGNVLEWVEDCWHSDYSGAPTDGSAWTSGGNCNRRVLRGGSWYNEPRLLRAANRFWDGYRETGTTISDSELPGRLPHESLPPYIGVPRGGAPWSIFSRDTRATIQ